MSPRSLSVPPCKSVGYNRYNAGKGAGFADRTLLHSYDPPPLSPKRLRDPTVASFVVVDLVAPKLGVRARQTLTGTPVPETAVHKNRYLAAGPSEIRLACDGPMLAIASQLGGPERPAEGNFRGSVSPRAYRRHDFRADFLRDVVHESPRPPYRFAYSLRSSELIWSDGTSL